MKLRSRKLLLMALVFFMIYVSYKILEPEIRGGQFHNQELLEMEKLRLKQKATEKRELGKVSANHDKDYEDIEIDKEDVVRALITKYRLNLQYPLSDSPWKVAAGWFKFPTIHPEVTPELGSVLKAMATREIISADVGHKGTQIKMLLELQGGQKVAFKPKVYKRDHRIEGMPYSGADRHNGEIASFHLGRLLELRRTPLAVGRVVNMDTEISPVATLRLKKTFYTKGNDSCFYGECHYCKGPETGQCADGQLFEGALVLWLPDTLTLQPHRHPWARTYKYNKMAVWQADDNYCNSTVLTKPMYSQGRLLLDLIDAAILDYMISNGDRHMYETVNNEVDSMMLIMDNSKSFGNPDIDVRDILAPLYQCCRLRESTWLHLLVLQEGILSRVLASMLSQDPIAPILTKAHLEALDRRLKHVLDIVQSCIVKFGITNVTIKDTK